MTSQGPLSLSTTFNSLEFASFTFKHFQKWGQTLQVLTRQHTARSQTCDLLIACLRLSIFKAWHWCPDFWHLYYIYYFTLYPIFNYFIFIHIYVLVTPVQLSLVFIKATWLDMTNHYTTKPPRTEVWCSFRSTVIITARQHSLLCRALY